MNTIGIDDIRSASDRIRKYIHKTPLVYSNSLSRMTGAEVYLKAENLQKTGSFKVRGAFNKILQTRGQVVAASMGNHAQAVAFAAQTLGVKARIVMPLAVTIVKEEATRGYGGEVILHGESFSDALNYARSQKDALFIHAFDDRDVIAGQGTIALEVMEDLERFDEIVVPVGGGGMLTGISVAVKALRPETKVTGVQSVCAPSAYESYRTGEIVSVQPAPTIADGIAIGRVGEMPFELMKHYVDDLLLVDDDSIALAVLLLLERKKMVVEGAGAVPLAALLEHRSRFTGRKIVLVLSGGNIDFSIVDRIIQKGLLTSGRVGIFEAILPDTSAGLHMLTGIISEHRGNIMNIFHDRTCPHVRMGETKVIFTVETKGPRHLREILEEIERQGLKAVLRQEKL